LRFFAPLRERNPDVDPCGPIAQPAHLRPSLLPPHLGVYRVAHNTAVSHVRGALRQNWVSLDEVQSLGSAPDPDRTLLLDRLMSLIHQLRRLDRQVILLYLEDHDARVIAEITGLSVPNVATKIHRIKNILTRRFHEGDTSHATERTPSGVAIPAVAVKPTRS
jgi:hypothetical protein